MEVRRRKHSSKNEDSTTFVDNEPHHNDPQPPDNTTTTPSTTLSAYVATPQWLLKTLMDWLFISMDYVREKLAYYIPILEPGLHESTKYYCSHLILTNQTKNGSFSKTHHSTL